MLEVCTLIIDPTKIIAGIGAELHRNKYINLIMPKFNFVEFKKFLRTTVIKVKSFGYNEPREIFSSVPLLRVVYFRIYVRQKTESIKEVTVYFCPSRRRFYAKFIFNCLTLKTIYFVF